MDKLSFDKTIKKFDLIISDLKYVDKKNDEMFRRVCIEIIQNSHSKMSAQNDFDTVAKFVVSRAIHAYKKPLGEHKNVLHAKSFKKIRAQTDILNYSNLGRICQFIKKSEITLVVKLLKIHYNFGLKATLSFVDSS